jgi:RNA polymerase sigma-70 factor, ECF subfamily
MDKIQEQTIAEGLQRGESHAWQQLYEAYCELIWKSVARLAGSDRSAVADIVQETFLEAARSARKFNPARGNMWIWLWTIARRQVALYYRRRKQDRLLNRSAIWWESLDGDKFDWLDAKADIPQDILQSQELAALVRYTLSKLPPESQMLLLAKYLDDEPGKSIAGRLNCSEVAVRSKLARARKAFRKVFNRVVRKTLD